MLLSSQSLGLIGMNLGLKVGQGQYKSLHFDKASINGTQFGGQILFTLLPFFDLEIGSDYFKKTYEYDLSNYFLYSSSSIHEYKGDVTFKSIGIYAGLRFKLDIPLIPFVPYAGGGIGSYQIKYQFEGEIAGFDFDIPIELPKNKKDDLGIHLNAGVRTKWMFIPIQVFVEGKYTYIFDSYENLKNYGIFVGILFPVL